MDLSTDTLHLAAARRGAVPWFKRSLPHTHMNAYPGQQDKVQTSPLTDDVWSPRYAPTQPSCQIRDFRSSPRLPHMQASVTVRPRHARASAHQGWRCPNVCIYSHASEILINMSMHIPVSTQLHAGGVCTSTAALCHSYCCTGKPRFRFLATLPACLWL